MTTVGETTYDWKYLICAAGKPSWDEFAVEHGTWATQPISNRDFDCARVAEQIASDAVSDGEVTFLLEDPHGNRFEVDLRREEVVQYETTACRELGKSVCQDDRQAAETKEYKCRWCAQWRPHASFVNAQDVRCAKCAVCRAKPRTARVP